MRKVSVNLATAEISSEQRFCSNKVKSTKYTVISFFPVSLLNQLCNAINDFFIVNGILQYIPAFSTNNPLISIIPVSFVILLGMVFELVEDIKRYLQDRKDNGLMVPRSVFDNGKITDKMTKSEELKVGHILKLNNN